MRNNPLDLGVNPDLNPDPGLFFKFLIFFLKHIENQQVQQERDVMQYTLDGKRYL